jgi:holo-[acyl-carrier protein] synthase
VPLAGNRKGNLEKSMIVATGIDSIEISRIEEVFIKRGPRFRDRVFTTAEIAYCEPRGSRFASYAVRFAAKEAIMKALGTGWAEGIGWREIEVVRGEKGPPSIRLFGRALELFNAIGARRVHLSLTHSRDTATAQVILES